MARCSYCWFLEHRERPGPYMALRLTEFITEERYPLCGYHLALLGMGKLEQA